MSILSAILLKIGAVLIFTVMSALIRLMSATIPIGEIIFFRGACAVIPVVVFYAFLGELRGVVRMGKPLGHFGRGTMSAMAMYLNFTSLAFLPLVDATAISFTSPLITVLLAVFVLNEQVRAYRWLAVGVGFAGVLVMLLPHFEPAQFASNMQSAAGAIGAACGLLGALVNAGTVIQTRRMTFTESTSAIVFYFSVFCAVGGLASLPLGWVAPGWWQLFILTMIGVLGGTGHLMLTESFRRAAASVIAPFDYTAMIAAALIGFAMFGEIPHVLVVAGAAIVAGAGLFVIWRERGLSRMRPGQAAG